MKRLRRLTHSSRCVASRRVASAGVYHIPISFEREKMQPATTTTTTPTTIDLHGYRKSEAIAALTSFLDRNQGQGWVTVITGSGAHSHNGPILRTAVQSLLEKRQMEFTLNRGKGSFLVNADSGFVLYDPEAPTDTKVVLQKASSANNKDYSSFTPMSKLVARAPPVSHMIPLPSEVATINDTNPKAMEKEIKKETNNDWEKDMNPLPSEVAANDANQKAMEKEIKKETKEIEQALSLSMKDHLTPKEDELRKAQKEVDEKDLQREVYDNLQWAATTTTTTARTNHRHPQDARTGRYSQPDHRFWKSKPDAASIDDDSNNCATALKSPDWSISTRWRPTMTSRFHHCLRNKKRTDRNLAFNILLAVATPELKLLASHQPVVDNNGNHPRWQRSRMKQHDVLEIIWVAKEYQWDGGRVEDKHYVGQVEAHFAGSRDECLQFVQKFLLVPKSSRNPTKDMSAIIPSNDGATTHTTQIDYAWLVDNDLQGAVLDDVMEDLPEGLFVLDPDQERIVTLKPPLLIESRSGTGKTNVLFKHAVSYFGSTLEEISRPVCFVTVSPRLCEELQRRYQTIEQINHVSLPPVQFFCLKSLLDKLLRMAQLDNIMEMSFVCTFWHYLHARKTYKKLSEEPSLVENEIGGVITGSLEAAIQKEPLSLQQYLETKRSNVPNHSEEGKNTRKRIYEEFKKYSSWKTDSGNYDMGDVVLRLLQLDGTPEFFYSAYLDEVQDFSYATIFLICGLAGKTYQQWVAAGDTAQMISPGCSFTFDGMKQTLRSLREDVELQKVEQLKKNYRMTKSVLEVSNGILKLLKKNFPHAVESANPEISMKDLGLRVVLVDWEKAFKTNVKFGTQQAIIYSSKSNAESVEGSISRWLGSHPFTLTSLESKGLEFDDVMVAFDFENKFWNVASKSVDSLRLLRELYVAVTRARRRVVVLVKKRVPAMASFFENLNLNLDTLEPDVILVEFEKEVKAEEWFQRGSQLFQEEDYKLASSCFNAGNSFGWAAWARGRQMSASGRKREAKDSFRTAVRAFFEASNFENCLDVMSEDISNIPPWEEEDNEIFDRALQERPHYFDRRKTVQLSLVRGVWNALSVDDLMNDSTSALFKEFRSHPKLQEMVDKFHSEIQASLIDQHGSSSIKIVEWYHSHNDRSRATNYAARILRVIDNDELLHSVLKLMKLRPDTLLEEISRRSLFVEASTICLNENSWDLDLAERISDRALETAVQAEHNVDKLLQAWGLVQNDGRVKSLFNLRKKRPSKISLLCLLFQNPELAGQSFGKQCFISFGESIVKKAVHAGGPYKKDVTSILCLFESKFALLKKPPMNKSRLAKNQQRAPKTNKQRKASPASDPKNGTKPRGRFIPGDRIMVVGLQNSKELNGQLGHVSGEFTKNGRHPIILDSDSTRKLKLAVKPENLKPVIESVSSGCDDDTSGCDSLPSLTPRFPNGTFPPMDGSPESDDSSNSDSDAFVAPLWAGGRQESSYSEDDDSVPPLFCPEKDDSGSDSSSGDDDSVPPLHSREESDSDSSPPPLFSGEGGSKIDRSSRTASSDSTNDSGDDENSDGVPDLFHRAEYDDSSSSDDSE